MVALKDILYKVTINKVVGNTNININNISFDSRNIADKDVFVAISGSVFDGNNFIEKAIKNGACAIVCEKLRSEEHTSELQSRENLVCRLLLEKKNKTKC